LNGISSGGGVIASQYYGAHDTDNVKKTLVNTGFIMLMVPLQNKYFPRGIQGELQINSSVMRPSPVLVEKSK